MIFLEIEIESATVRAIADASRELVRLRDAWLNPSNALESELKKRTLTKLYNERPAWLDNAHSSLDYAVLEAYGLAHSASKDEILAHLLKLNYERAAGIVRTPDSAQPPKKAPRSEKVSSTPGKTKAVAS